MESSVAAFETTEPLRNHWLQKLFAVLQPNPNKLQHYSNLDQAQAEEQERPAWKARADRRIDPNHLIRGMPGIGRTITVPLAHRGSRECSDAWAAAELRLFRGTFSNLICRGELTRNTHPLTNHQGKSSSTRTRAVSMAMASEGLTARR